MASVSRLPSQTGAEIAFLVAKSMYAPPCLTALDFSSTLGFLAALDALDEPADEHSCTDRVVNTSVLAHTQTRQQRQQLRREERPPCRCFSGAYAGRSGFHRKTVAKSASVLARTQTRQQRQELRAQ